MTQLTRFSVSLTEEQYNALVELMTEDMASNRSNYIAQLIVTEYKARK